jgi:hypothetical protein
MSVAPKKRHRRSQQAIQRTLCFVNHVYSFALIQCACDLTMDMKRVSQAALLFEIAGHIDPLIDAAAFAARHADVVFIGAAVALNAVLEVANAFFNVFTADFVKCVHMSTVTGIGAAVVAHVAGYALGIVVFVQSVQFGHFI